MQSVATCNNIQFKVSSAVFGKLEASGALGHAAEQYLTGPTVSMLGTSARPL